MTSNSQRRTRQACCRADCRPAEAVDSALAERDTVKRANHTARIIVDLYNFIVWWFSLCWIATPTQDRS